LAVAELRVQQHEPEVAQLPRAQPLELLGRRTRLRRGTDALLGLPGLDQRTDHERLAPGPQLFGDPLVGTGTLAFTGDHVRRGRPAPERALAQARLVEIPVRAERERARDRRRG